MQVGELFVFLGVKTDEAKIREFDKGLLGLINRLDVLKISALASAFGIKELLSASLASGDSFYNLAEQTGENITALREWASAAHAANPALSIDAVAQSIQNLDNSLVNIKRFGQGNLLPYSLFQINPGEMKNALDVLEALRSKVNLYDPATTSNLLSQMGLPPGIMSALKLSDEEWQRFTKNVSIDQDAIERLHAASQAIAELGNKWRVFRDNLVSDFAPQIEYAMEKISDAFDILPEHLGNLTKGFEDFKKFLEDFPAALDAIKIALGALALVIAPVTSLIAGMIYLFDKYGAYKNGEDNFFRILDEKDKSTEYPDRDKFTRPITLDDIHTIGSPNTKKAVTNSTVNINNDINFNGEVTKENAEHAVNYLDKNMKAYREFLRQDNINQSYTDQQGLGSDY